MHGHISYAYTDCHIVLDFQRRPCPLLLLSQAPLPSLLRRLPSGAIEEIKGRPFFADDPVLCYTYMPLFITLSSMYTIIYLMLSCGSHVPSRHDTIARLLSAAVLPSPPMLSSLVCNDDRRTAIVSAANSAWGGNFADLLPTLTQLLLVCHYYLSPLTVR